MSYHFFFNIYFLKCEKKGIKYILSQNGFVKKKNSVIKKIKQIICVNIFYSDTNEFINSILGRFFFFFF